VRRQEGDPGCTARDNRGFVEAVLWVRRTGSPWRGLPSELGHWHRTYVRFARWRDKGVWERGATAMRGGPTTKLHLAVDASGNPMRVILSAGQVADIECATALIGDPSADFIVADKGCDSDAFVAAGAQAVMPPRSHRLKPRSFDSPLDKDHHLVERLFARLKHFRRIATRYDKLATSFLSFVPLTCAFVWLA
jgi:transposase